MEQECIHCNGTGKCIGYELGKQYGTTTLIQAKCKECNGTGYKKYYVNNIV